MTGDGGTLRLAAERSQARAVCVLVHGRGQSPEEMRSHILARLAAPETAFFLPRAAASSWYAARAIDPVTEETRAELVAALDALGAVVAEARTSFPGLPLLLAGFSQGACLALEYCFEGRPPPEALVALTGCRVGHRDDERPGRFPSGLPVYLTGSDADPWIPAAALAEAAGELAIAGAALRLDSFPGRPHEAADSEVAMMASILADLRAGRAPTMEADR